MSSTPQVEFITKEIHTLSKGFVDMSKKLTEIETRSKYQEDRINEILANNKEVMKLIRDLSKQMADDKLESNKNYWSLVVKVTAISTILTFLGRKFFLIGM